MAQQAIIKFQGRLYIIQVPDGATTAEAALVFAREAARGNVSKLAPGGILASPDTIASLRSNSTSGTVQTQGPDISRQERGTAGVGREADVAGIVALTKLLLSYPVVKTTQVIDGINFADYITQTPPTFPVANLNLDQMQSLMAAIAAEVNQETNEISQEKGVGRYGLNALQLELAGYIKPGTALKYFNQNLIFQPNPDNFVETMRSPNIWSGKDQITSVDQILLDETLQAKIMQQLYQISYDALLSLGTLQQGGITADPLIQGIILQNAVQYGVAAATTWAIDRPPVALVSNMKNTARQALYAMQLLQKKITPSEVSIQDSTAYISTDSDAASVQNAVREIINNPKISTGPS